MNRIKMKPREIIKKKLFKNKRTYLFVYLVIFSSYLLETFIDRQKNNQAWANKGMLFNEWLTIITIGEIYQIGRK